MKFNPEKLIRFFDDDCPDISRKTVGSHSSAFNKLFGEELLLGLLEHYVQSIGEEEFEFIQLECNEIGERHRRLDAWVRKGDKYLKTELKNWSAHSTGGEQVPYDNEDELKEKSERRYNEFIKTNGGKILKIDSLRKVFLPMKPPNDDVQEGNIYPCILFWFCIGKPQKDGKLEPFFPVRFNESQKQKLKDFDERCEDIEELFVFSGSLYLRQYVKRNPDKKTIELSDLTNRLEERFRVLRELCPD